ncbi:hypothetical protein Riv7116_5292 [Rivularia sp. PCC 7116]|nr:hypothetical protein Riv7116_5292 [Rivularia sp. PCC 7116]
MKINSGNSSRMNTSVLIAMIELALPPQTNPTLNVQCGEILLFHHIMISRLRQAGCKFLNAKTYLDNHVVIV